VDTFSYSLLPNHFHLAVRVKTKEEIKKHLLTSSTYSSTLTKFQTLSKLDANYDTVISKQFSNFFSSYSQAFNKQQKRRGSLFERPFRRTLVDTDEYFKNLIHYIHYNPVHHGFVKDLRDWKFTSYESYFSSKSTLLKRDEVISWFHDKKGFEEFHKRELDDKMIIEFK
ncbi:MAG: hypothetical protein A2033_11485, partial [Bacteroidetes bacterium GWA2_31_9]